VLKYIWKIPNDILIIAIKLQLVNMLINNNGVIVGITGLLAGVVIGYALEDWVNTPLMAQNFLCVNMFK
jgi:hypothetical protein